MHFKMQSAKWRPFCPGGELKYRHEMASILCINGVIMMETKLYRSMFSRRFDEMLTSVYPTDDVQSRLYYITQMKI